MASRCTKPIPTRVSGGLPSRRWTTGWRPSLAGFAFFFKWPSAWIAVTTGLCVGAVLLALRRPARAGARDQARAPPATRTLTHMTIAAFVIASLLLQAPVGHIR